MSKLMEMKNLVKELNAAGDAYYNGKDLLMSDYEFDLKLEHLSELEKELDVVLSNSPTVNVGAPVLKEIKTIKMEQRPMLSLDKVHSSKEVIDFAKGKSLVASVKCDGMSTRIVYQDGKLVGANSRGNGIEGSDLTEHVKHFINVPLTINAKGTYIIDGESIIKDFNFELINSKFSYKNKLKNSRNAVAGTLASLDTSVVDERMVSFIAWDVIEGSNCNDFHGRLYEAQCLGFEVVPYEFIENPTEKNIEPKINTMFEISELQGIPNDGVVFRLADVEYGASMGCTSHHFLNAVAYKKELVEYETELIDIEWNCSKNSINPVAIFKPTIVNGNMIERASCHNVSYVEDLELGIGDKITIYLANEIIPQINQNLTRSCTCKAPEYCPVCGDKTEIVYGNDETKTLVCTNDMCKSKLLGRLKTFVSKQGMDIDGLSEATLDLLMSRNYITCFKDIYHLSDYKAELSSLPKMGSRSVKKLLNAIEDSRTTTLDRLLTSLSIPLIGKSTAKDIAAYCHGSVDEFSFIMSNTSLEFAAIDGVGVAATTSLDDWWCENSEMFYSLLDELDIEVPEEKKETNTGVDLNNATFCITGKLNHFTNRDTLVENITFHNGKYLSGVSSKLNYLINNDKTSTSGKNKKALEMGCKIISESDYLAMIGETN